MDDFFSSRAFDVDVIAKRHLSSDLGKLIDLDVGDAGALVLVHHLHSVRPGKSDHRLEDASQWAWRLPLLTLILKLINMSMIGSPCPTRTQEYRPLPRRG